ncbi:unnamed protein product [Paramecium pentaurelia]|uniref:EGF-like domain-containing protein n=1 Tax=Paramecium pentaurelia TaxID=43138 RepID=A0A8S1XQX8_9CILI|nr:unnamed protein product [Paramecium pentaurelia]
MMFLIPLILLFQPSFSFRSFGANFTKANSNFSCPQYHYYQPDLIPHTCVGYISICKGVTEVTIKIQDNQEVLCHPRFQAFYLMPLSSNNFIVRCISPFTTTYQYNQNGDVTYSCQQTNIGYCLLAQNYTTVLKCQYCYGYAAGPLCNTLLPGIQSGIFQCNKNLICLDGYTKSSLSDTKCSYQCKLGDASCSYEPLTECIDYCNQCRNGICSSCITGYQLVNGKCFGDPNCMKFQIVYNSNNSPTGINCLECDFGYFKKGQICQLCSTIPGLETCFLCNSETECKTCQSRYYLNDQKKCVPFDGCDVRCNTCLTTNPKFCTTCDYINFKRVSTGDGNCVCAQAQNYAEKYGSCVLCTEGFCKTCTLNFFECTSCDPARNRILVDNNCPCLQGYYETELDDKKCLKCHETCYNCDNPTKNDCTECDSLKNRYLFQGQCLCKRGYVEILSNGALLCLACHSRCEKCSKPKDATTNQYCTLCIPGQKRMLTDKFKCECMKTYGDNNGLVDICYQCYYTCGSCVGDQATNCNMCLESSYRYLTLTNECKCKDNYYEDGINNRDCKRCHYSCYNCDSNSNIDQCIQCPPSRIPDGIGSTFKCLCSDPHTFDDGQSLICSQCHYSCKTCNGYDESDCLTCDLDYRQFVFSKCECPTGYYEVGQLQCSQCHFTCQNCYDKNQDNCITCSADLNRILMGNTCQCKSGTSDYNGTQAMCDKCSYRCADCTQVDVNQCISCPEFSFRELGSNKSCSCPSNLIDIPTNPICQICHFTCSSCSGFKSTQCTQCSDLQQRQLNSLGECECKSHYYEIGSAECQICSKFCLDCYQTADSCTSCQPDRYLDNVSTCLCKTKLQGIKISTFQFSTQTSCSNCHYSCLTCDGFSSSNCTSCLDSENRIQTGSTCGCKSNYFDFGSTSCQQCSYKCETCFQREDYCLSCSPSSLRQHNNLLKLCNCPNGYYDDGINSICQKCHYSCLKCMGISTNCELCSDISKRILDVNLLTCNCIQGYYDDGVEICKQCHYSCLSCNGQGSNSCNSCLTVSTTFRVFYNKTCNCLSGYYDDGSSINCKKCQNQCLTCQTYSYQCLLCPITRHLIGQSCVCDEGYYDIGTQKCNECNSNCLSCQTTSINCTSCDSTKQRVLNIQTKTCVCQNGTIEINGICQECNASCKTCQNSISQCTSCQSMRLLINNECICIDGTYESSIDNKCHFCYKTCLTCVQQDTTCLTCSDADFRIMKPGNICACFDGYFENSLTLSCNKCDNSCKTCELIATNCTSCDEVLNYNQQFNQCVCKSGYFYNAITKLCEACNFTCKECSSQFNCIECDLNTRYFDDQNFKCLCQDGYYEVNLNQCQICNISCQTCITSSNNCTSCETLLYYRILNNNQCICQDGYYDIGISMCQQCNGVCKTCQLSAFKCYSCYQNDHIRILVNNQCICQSGYFDNGTLVCQKCSNECLTCSGSENHCTSCDINQKRIDQSIIYRCPCITGFYSDENKICQKCHIKCASCLNQNDHCLSCKFLPNNNRYTLSQNCDCKSGYYDDGIQLQCQQCNPRCKTCLNTSIYCQTCFDSLRFNPPQCDCINGYFENEQKQCQPCNHECNTCINESQNCLTCKPGRITNQCICQEGYFEAGLQACLKCDIQCNTCNVITSNCLTCKGDRINPPNCTCSQGYFDDYVNDNCQLCDSLCKTCNRYGCISCAGNRILSEEFTCDPPENSICNDITPWCSTCEVAVLNIQISDDLKSIIVIFDFPLNPQSISSQVQQNVCYQILSNTSLIKFGLNPQCKIDDIDNKILYLNFGSNPTIIEGDTIEFLPNTLQQQDCNVKLSIFILNNVKSPQNPVSPILEFNVPEIQLNPCDNNIITIKSKSNDGFRGLKNIIWTYIVYGSFGNGDLDNFVQQQTSLQLLDLNIDALILPIQSNITFTVRFSNFIGQQSQQIIKILTHSGAAPSVNFNVKKQFYSFSIINIAFTIQKINCTTQLIENSNYQISLQENARTFGSSSEIDYKTISNQKEFNIKIPSYKLTPRALYTFQLNVSDSSINYFSSQQTIIEIIPAGFLCKFNGVQPIQDYKKDLKILIECQDLDTKYLPNQDPDLTINVNCTDLSTNNFCLDMKSQKIKVNKTDYEQNILKYSVKSFTVQSWKVTAYKNGSYQTFEQIVVFLEDNFRELQMNYSMGYNMRPINSYETLNFTYLIPIRDLPLILEYSIGIIYDFEVLAILQPSCYQYQFRLFDYYRQFNKGNQINLKFLVQYINDIMPAQYNLKINLNQPPQCTISIDSKGNKALSYINVITNCLFSIDTPYKYQLRILLNEKDYVDYKSTKSDYSLILYSFQSSNKFQILLPYSQIYVIVQIMDADGSITNIEQEILIDKIDQIYFNCSTLSYQNSTFRYQIALALELFLNNNQNQICLQVANQIFSNIKQQATTYKFEDQQLAYKFIKVYTHYYLNMNYTNSTNLTQRTLQESSINRCYDNTSQKFIITNSKDSNEPQYNYSYLQTNVNKLKNNINQLIKDKFQLELQINEDSLILQESLFQQRELIIESLQISILFIDDAFSILSKTIITMDSEKILIYNIGEQLLQLIQSISDQINSQAQVDGNELNIYGQQVSWKLKRQSKTNFNKLSNIEFDFTDHFVAFIEKAQTSISYNFYHLLIDYQYQLQQQLNYSYLQIDQNKLIIVRLRNYRTMQNYVNQDNFSQKYNVQLEQLQYCEETQIYNQNDIYQPSCIQLSNTNLFHICDINAIHQNTSVQVLCNCNQFGNVFLIQIPINQTKNKNNSEISIDPIITEQKNLQIFEQPFILLQSILICFSILIYYQLYTIENKPNEQITQVYQNIESSDDLNKIEKKEHLKCYPGDIFIIKENYKYIHQFFSIFYCDDLILKKSYRFLQFFTELSFLNPMAICLITVLSDELLLKMVFFINFSIILLMRFIFKLFQAIYRFGGRCAIFIVFILILLQILSYILFIYALINNNENTGYINIQIFLISGGTIVLTYFIYDPVIIMVRILLYKIIIQSIKSKQLNPLYHFVYFFIQNYKLDEIFDKYIIF